MNLRTAPARTSLLTLMLSLGACGGGSSNSTPAAVSPPPPPPSPPPVPVPTLDPQYLASAPSPFVAGCDGVAQDGTVYPNAEVEPYLAIDPLNPQHLIGVWQQDRWSTGGARGIIAGVSNDGGKSWTQHAMPMSRCGGGNAINGGDFERASNAWVTIAPDGTANMIALAFNGQLLAPGSLSAVLSSRSSDGGANWGPVTTLILDGQNAFDDKDVITADPVNPQFVYAVWDRLTSDNTGPSYFTRSTNGGVTWETPRAIYDPGVGKQTISNAIVVLPNGTVVDMFLEIDPTPANALTSHIAVIRSTDNGTTWSAPFKVADNFSVGTRDPDTGVSIRDSALIPEIAVGIGGSLIVVWQDSRFSNGAHDSVALAQSGDGGFTWSAPVRVNADASVPAFSPMAHVRSDGLVGVSYYDFRDNTANAASLLTDYWLARSAEAVNWQETQIAGPFNLALAPVVTTPGSGYFLGDYQGLISIGTLFVPLFVQTNSGNVANPTDVFAAPAVSVSAMATAKQVRLPENVTVAFVVTPELRQRVSQNIANAMEQRLPGWRQARHPD
ncbi:MAG: sialidase family protein [Rudaea sp.]|nr:sialidase family protein [Rudaea sp.]